MYSSIWPASILSFLEADLLVLPRLSKSNHIATCTELESSGIQQRIDTHCPKKHFHTSIKYGKRFIGLPSLRLLRCFPWAMLRFGISLLPAAGAAWRLRRFIEPAFLQVLNGPHSLQKGHPVAVCRFTLQDCFKQAPDVDHCKHLFSLGGFLDTCVYFEYIRTIQNTTTCIYTEFTCRLYIGAAFMESRSYYVVKKSPFKRYHVQVQYCVMLTLDS